MTIKAVKYAKEDLAAQIRSLTRSRYSGLKAGVGRSLLNPVFLLAHALCFEPLSRVDQCMRARRLSWSELGWRVHESQREGSCS